MASDSSTKPPGSSSGDGSREEPAEQDGPRDALVPDVIANGGDAVDAARQTLDIDFGPLLALAARGKAAEDGLARAREALELRERFEAQRVKHFREIMDAVNEAKWKDPDEVERREANKIRRGLTSIIGVLSLVGMGSVVYLASRDSTNLVAMGIVTGLTTMTLALTGVLASGGALSPRQVLSIIRVATGQAESARAKPRSTNTSRGRK